MSMAWPGRNRFCRQTECGVTGSVGGKSPEPGGGEGKAPQLGRHGRQLGSAGPGLPVVRGVRVGAPGEEVSLSKAQRSWV